MKGFVIFGYYGCGNIGDETNLRELVSYIRLLNRKADITVITATPEETEKKLKVSAVGKFHFFDIILSLREADLLIGGGGSLFQDRTSLRSLFYYSTLVCLAKLLKVRIMMYGQGIGPLRSKIGKLLAGWVLSKVDLITVRDRLSIITLAELNVRKPEIFITAEPLLLLNQLSPEVVNSFWRNYQTEKRLKLGLIIQKTGFLKKKFWKQLLECLSWDQNVELYLLPMEKRDPAFLKELAVQLNLTMLPVQSRWEEFQQVIGGLDLVVSARLHGLVAAVIQKIPCYGLAMDPKIEGFCLQLGVPFLRPATKMEWLTLGNRILTYLYQPSNEKKPWEAQLSFWQTRAYENQLILKKFIM